MNTTQNTQSTPDTPDTTITQALGPLWTPPADMTQAIRKVIDLGEDPGYGTDTDTDGDGDTDTDSPGDRADIPRVFVEIEIRPVDTEHGRRGILSVTATTPGACGQIREIIAKIARLSPGWTPALRDELLTVWDRDHLRAISPEVYTWISGLPTGADDLPATGHDAHGPIDPSEVAARRFLSRWGIRARFVHVQARACSWGGDRWDTRKQHWTVALTGPVRSGEDGRRAPVLRFDFWNSQHDTALGRPLSRSAVLSSLASDLQYHEDPDGAAELFGVSDAWEATREQVKRIAAVTAWAARIDAWVAKIEDARPGFRASLEAHCR